MCRMIVLISSRAKMKNGMFLLKSWSQLEQQKAATGSAAKQTVHRVCILVNFVTTGPNYGPPKDPA